MKNTFLIFGLSICLYACSSNNSSTNNAPAPSPGTIPEKLNVQIPQERVLSQAEMTTVQTVSKQLSDISVENLALYSDNESASEKQLRYDKIQKASPYAQSLIQRINQSCELQLVHETDSSANANSTMPKLDKVINGAIRGSQCPVSYELGAGVTTTVIANDPANNNMASQIVSHFSDKYAINATDIITYSGVIGFETNSSTQMTFKNTAELSEFYQKTNSTRVVKTKSELIQISVSAESLSRYNTTTKDSFVENFMTLKFSVQSIPVVISKYDFLKSTNGQFSNDTKYYLNGLEKTKSEIENLIQMNLETASGRL